MNQPFDVARASAALQRPGIDPRTWTTLAVVTAVNTTAQGIYCDVTTILGLEETAAYAPQYAGSGYGFYTPIEEGDLVLIAVPEGDWGAGARIIAEVWDQGQPPPAEVVDHPLDVALVVKPGQTVRMIVSGGGDVVIEARDGGKVKLGNESASRGVARIADTVALTAEGAIALQATLDGRYAIANPATQIAGGPIGAITTASADVVAT